MSAAIKLEEGAKAPSFKVLDQDGKKVSLADYKGHKVILYFYPAAATPGCTKEACDFNDNLNPFKKAGYTVLGISPDAPSKLLKFKQSQDLNFPLLSDFNKEAASAYGVLYETFPAFEMQGVSKRAAFVIDKEGVVRYAEVCPTPGDLPNFEAIQQTLNSLN